MIAIRWLSPVGLSLIVATWANASEAPAPTAPAKPPARVASTVVLPTKGDGGQFLRLITQNKHLLQLVLDPQIITLDIPKDDQVRFSNEPFTAGDTVKVGSAGAPLKVDKRVIANLAPGRLLAVREINGDWFATAIVHQGAVETGWVPKNRVQFHSAPIPVHPTLSTLQHGQMLSAAALAQKAKQLDDGLYAAVDLAAQHGAGEFTGKAGLLAGLAAEMNAQRAAPGDETIGVVLAAARLGAPDSATPAAHAATVKKLLAEFQKDPLRSKPIGFYTWSKQLEQIFAQDRMLQSKLSRQAGIAALVEALRADGSGRATYEGYLRLVSRLTNPLSKPDLRPLLADPAATIPTGDFFFFPPSRSHEADLVMRLYADRPIPDGFNLADELIARVKSGDIDLAPRDDSGWYDYQTWSLAPLILPDACPESKRLRISATYREHLRELFKGILALARETHVKQLEMPAPAAEAGGAQPDPKPVFVVRPELSVEPLVESYLRRALSYHFVRGVIEETFGAEALATMHRQAAAGPVEMNLADELRQTESLFVGAAVTAARQLGFEPALQEQFAADGADAAARHFLDWATNAPLDVDVGQDARMMVPVFYDQQRRKTKVWIFLGWSGKEVHIGFERAPQATVYDEAGKEVPASGYDLHFWPTSAPLATPVVAEVYVTRLLNRQEFRRHCDAYQTREAILANLE